MADRIPTCHKRPMARRNGQFVCTRCRGWIDMPSAATGTRTGDQ